MLTKRRGSFDAVKDIPSVAQRADRDVAKDMQAWTIATGVPAKVVRSVEA
jgi:hypothetical protein